MPKIEDVRHRNESLSIVNNPSSRIVGDRAYFMGSRMEVSVQTSRNFSERSSLFDNATSASIRGGGEVTETRPLGAPVLLGKRRISVYLRVKKNLPPAVNKKIREAMLMAILTTSMGATADHYTGAAWTMKQLRGRKASTTKRHRRSAMQ